MRPAKSMSASGTKHRSKRRVHDEFSSASGGGTTGISTLCTLADRSVSWNDASRLRIAPMAWRATTRRVAKLRPLRMRSTS